MDDKRRKLVLSELAGMLVDQQIFEKDKEDLEKRIMIKLKSLGVKGSNYSETVIKMTGVRDKYAEAFIKAEKLIKERDLIVEELNIINENIKFVRDKMQNSKEIEYKVFNLKYFNGLTNKEIAVKENYSIDRVKQISAKISKLFSCQ